MVMGKVWISTKKKKKKGFKTCKRTVKSHIFMSSYTFSIKWAGLESWAADSCPWDLCLPTLI